MSCDPKSEPLSENIQRIAEERQKFVDEHEGLRASSHYRGAIQQIDRYIIEYGAGLNAIDLYSTRIPGISDRLISLRIKPHFVQSIVAASHMIKEGLYDPAKREMRFLVEASIKALWLDQGSPSLKSASSRGAPSPQTVGEKIAALDGLGRERFHEVVESLTFAMLDAQAARLYLQTAKSLYGSLSTTTHLSTPNVARDLANFDKGKHFAFETVADVNAMAQVLRRVLDLALASHFEAFDHALVGDLFAPPFLPNWSFLNMPLVNAIDRHFAYKSEREKPRT